LWRREFTSYEEILRALETVGKLRPIKRETIEGDNPSYRYFEVGDTGVKVGVLALFSWEYPCGKCHKLRIQPNGSPSICLSLPTNESLVGKSIEEKTRILGELIKYREEKLDKVMPKRKHYRPRLGEMRFGDLGKSIPFEYFYKLL